MKVIFITSDESLGIPLAFDLNASGPFSHLLEGVSLDIQVSDNSTYWLANEGDCIVINDQGCRKRFRAGEYDALTLVSGIAEFKDKTCLASLPSGMGAAVSSIWEGIRSFFGWLGGLIREGGENLGGVLEFPEKLEEKLPQWRLILAGLAALALGFWLWRKK